MLKKWTFVILGVLSFTSFARADVKVLAPANKSDAFQGIDIWVNAHLIFNKGYLWGTTYFPPNKVYRVQVKDSGSDYPSGQKNGKIGGRLNVMLFNNKGKESSEFSCNLQLINGVMTPDCDADLTLIPQNIYIAE